MSETLTQQNLGLTVSTPLGHDTFRLASIRGEERLSGLFHFTLELLSEQNDLDFNRIVGQNVTVTVQMEDGVSRYFNGVVGRFVQAGSDARFTTYHADLHPWLWLLTMTRDNRIFQNQSAPNIIETVFKDLGCTDYRNALSRTYTAREYCVQYQESAFDFVSRLMEDEGIFYFFEHETNKHTLVLADDRDAHADCPARAQVRWMERLMEHVDDDVVTNCTWIQQVAPTAYMMDDFNFETPTTELLVQAKGASSQRTIYEYPGGYSAKQVGETKVDHRLHAQELPQKRLQGHGYCPTFTSGNKFTLSGHPRTDLNGSYVLRWLSHTATPEGYANAFEAFPIAAPFRPPQATPKPVIAGSQTAIVVGKSGEEIWTDKYGRVKVQFPWDQQGKRDENSSCWIRVAQGWAGKGWGSQFLPRIGHEVIVSFLHGDPDYPIITGAVYNGQQTVPYALPSEQTKSTVKSNSSKGGGGFNEIRFEDKKSVEEIFVHAQKDMNVTIKENRTSTLEMGNDTLTLKEGNSALVLDKGNRVIQVKNGNESHTVQGTRDLAINGKETHTNKADFTQQVSGNFTLQVDGDLTLDVKGSLTIKAGQSITIKAGAALAQEAGTSLTAKAGTSLTNQAGTSLTAKAGLDLTNQAGATLTSKASATQTVDGGGLLTLKGGIVKIN